ncbi:MAG: NUDIX hydrolase [Candidatus Marinimicrobia bacterium]|nr:NUDIX hydrolase [Candidatus Neomarinimicrobiota bacterium]
MRKLKEKKKHSADIFIGKLLHIKKDTVELSNGNLAHREWIKHPGAACCIPIFSNSKIGLIKQFRYAVGKEMIEIPAGKLDKNEKPIECATRELEEEIGYKTQKVTLLTEIHPAVGFCNEKISIYLAEELIKTKINLDSDEFVELIPTKLNEALELIENGIITDAKTIIALLWYEKYLSKNTNKTIKK